MQLMLSAYVVNLGVERKRKVGIRGSIQMEKSKGPDDELPRRHQESIHQETPFAVDLSEK